MKPPLTLFAIAGAVFWASAGNSQETGYDVVQVTFESADSSGDGIIDLAELTEMSDNIFAGMDYDLDGKVSQEELFGFDFGIERLAEERGEGKVFAAAKRILFALRDRNTDGVIDGSELKRSTLDFFHYADLDGSAALSQKEYVDGYMPSLIFKAALVSGG